MAFYPLEDRTLTSQGAESQMWSSVRNPIRGVEPQLMLQKFVEVHHRLVNERSSAALRCTSPDPTHVEKHLASLIQKARVHQPSVRFVEGTNVIDSDVISRMDATVMQRVSFSRKPKTPPLCCAYSSNGDGFTCFHGVAVIAEKYGSINLQKFKFIGWCTQYNGIFFAMPVQDDVDNVMAIDENLVVSVSNMSVLVAIAPPSGSPPKNYSKQLQAWYEIGAKSTKRRRCGCSLCGTEGHTSISSDLR